MERIVRKVSFEQSEVEMLDYWSGLTVHERLRQAFEWNLKVWQHLNNGLIAGMDKSVGGKKLKSQTDEDDF